MPHNPNKSGDESSPEAKGLGSAIQPGSLPKHASPKKGGDASSPSEASGFRQMTAPKSAKSKGVPPYMNE